jgi:hypothetical protein
MRGLDGRGKVPGTRFLWCSAHGDYASAGIRVYRGLSASRCMLAPRPVGSAPPAIPRSARDYMANGDSRGDASNGAR